MENEQPIDHATRALTTRTPDDPTPLSTLAINQLVERASLVKQAMKAAMVQGEHFGVIPGTGNRPTLLKPGAEKLCTLFRCAPDFTILRATETADEITFIIRCDLIHSPTGQVVGSGIGSCSSRESKYQWRKQLRKCPACGRSSIIKGKAEYGGGWVCWSKNKAECCGAKFNEVDRGIIDQPEGRVVNPDLHDSHNTILKMAQKRALIAGSLVAFAASDIFTQDLEDHADAGQASAATPVTSRTSEPQASAQAANVQRMTGATADKVVELAKALDMNKDDLVEMIRSKFGHGWAALSEVEGQMVVARLRERLKDTPAATQERQQGEDDGPPAEGGDLPDNTPPWMR